MRVVRALGGALALCACGLLTSVQHAAAQNAGLAEASSSGFWGGIDVGYARLSRLYSVSSASSEGQFTMALRGGIAIDPQLLLGIELGGWTIESADLWNPAKGEAISTRFLIAQYRPMEDSRFFLRGGGGSVVYWNHRPGEDGASGTGYFVGLGYDIPYGAPGAAGALYTTLSADYSRGGFDGATSPPGVVQDQRYRALSVRLGVTLR
jgi:hypothetical protein